MKSWLKLRSLGYINLIYWKIGCGCKNGTRYNLIEEVLQNVKITYVEIIVWKKLLPPPIYVFPWYPYSPRISDGNPALPALMLNIKILRVALFCQPYQRNFLGNFFHWHWSYCVIETEILVFCTFLE